MSFEADITRKIGFGRFRDYSVSFVGIYDYSQLEWVSKEAGQTGQKLRESAQIIMSILDVIKPKKSCDLVGCLNNAYLIGFEGTGPRMNLELPYFGCDTQHIICEDPKTTHPLSFSDMKKFYRYDEKQFRTIARIYREAFGFQGKLTNESAIDFIKSKLEEKVH